MAWPGAADPTVNVLAPSRGTDKCTSMDGRVKLLQSAFRACDHDGDGRLACAEFRPIATATGYDGSSEEWAIEYGDLCSEHSISLEEGIRFDQFVKLLNDKSQRGCYCTDEEIKLVITAQSADRRQPTGDLPNGYHQVPPTALAASSRSWSPPPGLPSGSMDAKTRSAETKESMRGTSSRSWSPPPGLPSGSRNSKTQSAETKDHLGTSAFIEADALNGSHCIMQALKGGGALQRPVENNGKLDEYRENDNARRVLLDALHSSKEDVPEHPWTTMTEAHSESSCVADSSETTDLGSRSKWDGHRKEQPVHSKQHTLDESDWVDYNREPHLLDLEGDWEERDNGQSIQVVMTGQRQDHGKAMFWGRGKSWCCSVSIETVNGRHMICCGPFKLAKASWGRRGLYVVQWAGIKPCDRSNMDRRTRTWTRPDKSWG